MSLIVDSSRIISNLGILSILDRFRKYSDILSNICALTESSVESVWDITNIY
jgi:hypothetical protein